MNPVTHLLASWTVADAACTESKDREIVTWAGMAPDLDGLVVLGDLVRPFLGLPPAFYYAQYHHSLTHGLPAAAVTALAAGFIATRKARTALLAFLVFHIHLLCDIVGSRGPTPESIWPLPYLAPLSQRWTIEWRGQWPLNAWPNIALTLLLLAVVLVRAARRGYSPVGLFSKRADAAYLIALCNAWPFRHLRGRGRGAGPA
jgi:inner membrane protein